VNIESWQNAIKTPWNNAWPGKVGAISAMYQVYALDDHRKHMPELVGVIVVKVVVILN
jgi:hypothetical protein